MGEAMQEGNGELLPMSPPWFQAIRGELSVIRMAALAGVTRQTWASWEAGASAPNARQFPMLTGLAKIRIGKRLPDEEEAAETPQGVSRLATPLEAQIARYVHRLSDARKVELLGQLAEEVGRGAK
jgi:transcriptional regulator with XRE-family HTH domain